MIYREYNAVEQQFSTLVLQELLKHAIPDYLISDTDLFSLRLLNKTVTTANTIGVWCERIKIIPIFCQIGKNIMYFSKCHRILVISLWVPWDEKVENHSSKKLKNQMKKVCCFHFIWKGRKKREIQVFFIVVVH